MSKLEVVLVTFLTFSLLTVFKLHEWRFTLSDLIVLIWRTVFQFKLGFLSVVAFWLEDTFMSSKQD